MTNNLNKTTRIIIGVSLTVFIWIIGILIGQEQTVLILNPEAGLKGIITRTKIVKVSLMLDYGDGKVAVFPEMKINSGKSVLQLLEAIDNLENQTLNIKYQQDEKTGEVSDLSIAGYQTYLNDKQWLVWMNNILQTDNINNIVLKSGDVIEFKYIKLIN